MWARDRFVRDPGGLAQTTCGKIYFQTITPQDISATQIREAIAAGTPVDKLLPPGVFDYIRTNRIYRNRGN